ncbi:hypothetical protein Aros01_05236 [Streptosporangium roseum]
MRGPPQDHGTSSLAHLEENMAAADVSLSREDLGVLDRLA